MKKVYKFNKEWLDLLLENKDNENASFVLSDNDTRILLTYIEILQNRIDKAIELIKNKISTETYQHLKVLYNDIDKIEEVWEDYEFDDLLDILKEKGE